MKWGSTIAVDGTPMPGNAPKSRVAVQHVSRCVETCPGERAIRARDWVVRVFAGRNAYAAMAVYHSPHVVRTQWFAGVECGSPWTKVRPPQSRKAMPRRGGMCSRGSKGCAGRGQRPYVPDVGTRLCDEGAVLGGSPWLGLEPSTNWKWEAVR